MKGDKFVIDSVINLRRILDWIFGSKKDLKVSLTYKNSIQELVINLCKSHNVKMVFFTLFSNFYDYCV